MTDSRLGRRKAPDTGSVYDKPLPKGKSEINLSTFAFLFSEVVQYNHGRVTSLTQLHEKLSELGHHVGFRMIDVLALREKAPKRETKHVNMLWFIQKTLWKTLFGKEADRLEQATANTSIYYLFEDEPLVNKFISVPKDQSSLNCAAFMAGVIEAFLNGTQFPCKVRAFGIKDKPTTAFEIRFEDSVLSRDKILETLK
ncbi:trafficking protein particle complex subunit 5-like [Halichondria panicea]|uniref:trafficking protein particle complex subunit 5-like n=1 Tax=Halichondria panicea TaxID=6063 RepID=UPI00312B5635